MTSQISPPAGQPQSEYTVGSSIRNDQPQPTVNGNHDSHKYPRDPRDVYFDAIERLQTQTSQNTSALAAQARTQVEAAAIVAQIESSLHRELQGQLQRQDQELRRMSETVNQLVRELAECRQTMMGLAHEVHVARTETVRRPSEAAQPGYQDDALELMARRIGEVAHRTTDLETLRDHVAILGGKIHRIESETAPTRQTQAQAHPQYATQQPSHPAHVAHPPPPHPPPAPAYQTPARPVSIPQPVPTHETPVPAMPLESTQRQEAAPAQNGWATDRHQESIQERTQHLIKGRHHRSPLRIMGCKTAHPTKAGVLNLSGWARVYEGHPAHPARSVVRRGGGGGSLSRVGSFSGERTHEWTPEIGPRTVYHIQDSPIEVKKTRSKPVRNEDGILVRKDGRPDRRSQSSAANLRKVHARKEEQQRETERLSTPTRPHATSTGPNSASPSPHDQLDPNVTESVRKKHHDILGRIFPEGLDNSRKQHDYAHQVFNEDHDHTAHPRAQVARTGKHPMKIKKENSERREVAETQAASEDVEMGDDADSTNENGRDDTQTPSGEVVHGQPQETGPEGVNGESRVQIPETQATDDSGTLAAKSGETA
ncbi:hypothetical protein E8E13_007817 [Curvularia kusanoi]|uniref:Uncharacterized protein n=1 Tax=Curvularia kusanoi TaxID=90978 RepID=A0A9P4WAZ7_CURKU|nr:hypothetical protein E8E13_007817 [Curvularia kusanoi]